MKTPTFYALVVIDENGQESLAGAFKEASLADAKGKKLAKRYIVSPAYLS
jgi:hypothetical protein